MTKKLQVALDLKSTHDALNILDKVAKHVDIIELGTPLLIAEGAHVIKAVKEKYPDKIVFADSKIMDGGAVIPKICFEAGADMVSVLAAADDKTIRASLDVAHIYNGQVLVDMCSVKDLRTRAQEISQMNPTFLCVHVGYDLQSTGLDPIAELKKLDGIVSAKAIAGGINLSTFEDALKSSADLIICGAGIYEQENACWVASEMRRLLDNYNHTHESSESR